MAEAIFIINNQNKNITVQCLLNEQMQIIFNKFWTKYAKSDEKLESFIFKYEGKEINPKLTFEELANENDKKNNNIYISVYKKDNIQEIQNSLSQEIDLAALNSAESQNITNEENKNYKLNEKSKLNNNIN